MTERYIILIEVDNKRALSLYREAWSGIEALWTGITAHCEALDKGVRARWAEEDAEAEKKMKSGRYIMHPSAYRWYGELAQPRYDSIRATIKRGLDIATQAISPFKATEEQALLLSDIESGDWIGRIENFLSQDARNV